MDSCWGKALLIILAIAFFPITITFFYSQIRYGGKRKTDCNRFVMGGTIYCVLISTRNRKRKTITYAQRKETVERVFADAKEKHGMRYTPYRGLDQVTKWVRLKFAALNLKKLAIHLGKDRRLPLVYAVFICFPCRKSVFA